jgi:alkanesulfonate monooxygenase SsuD/methylene tetrahydromethanopterin reductase-like flavin-dependent oxidoreductase (luciferase family)
MAEHRAGEDGPLHDPGSDLVATGHWPATRRKASLGLMVPISEQSAFGGTPHFRDVIEICRTAAEVGFEALWFADHFIYGNRADGFRGSWDAWTMMAAVAAAVPDVQVGPMVACTAYRNPGVIVKMTEMIDDISDGRFILGLGAGWHKPEYDQFGIPFEPRVTRFEEAMRIIHPLLRNGEVDVQGEYYQANDAVNLPRGPRPAGPPILIGSNGHRMLRILARYADAWNTSWHNSTDKVIPQLERLDEACLDMGRDPATVVRTVGLNVAREGYTGSRPEPVEGDTDATAGMMDAFRTLGFGHLICGLDPCTPASVAAFAPVIEAYDAGA